MKNPLASLPFDQLGLKPAFHRELLGEYAILPALPAERRWIGVMEERDILSAELEPTSAGDYGIDDVELGVAPPEPGALFLWAWFPVVVRPRSRAGTQRGHRVTVKQGE